MGNCIGIRNYLYFFVFVLSVVVSVVYVGMMCLSVLWKWFLNYPMNYPLVQLVASILFLPLVLFFGVFASMLLCFHVLLILRRQTTSEFFRRVHPYENSVMTSIMTLIGGFLKSHQWISSVYAFSPMKLVDKERGTDLLHEELHSCECLWPRSTLLLPMTDHVDYQDQQLQDMLIANFYAQVRAAAAVPAPPPSHAI